MTDSTQVAYERRKCEKCHRQESGELELYVTSLRPGVNPLLCLDCGNGNNVGWVTL